MRTPVLIVAAAALALTAAGCSNDDDIDTVAARVCDEVVDAYQTDDEAFLDTLDAAAEQVDGISEDQVEAHVELMIAFEDACPQLEEMMREDIAQ